MQQADEVVEQRAELDPDEEILELDPEALACMTVAGVKAFYKQRGFKAVQGRRT